MAWVIFFVHLTVVISLSFLLWKKFWSSYSYYWPALVFKLASGICLGVLYRYYFPVGDTFVYFHDGARLAALATDDMGSFIRLLVFDEGLETSGLVLQEPRALFLSKLTSLFNLLTMNNYWAIGLYYSLISFLASWYLVMRIRKNLPSVSLAAVIAFLFMPSVVFWSSGLLKESLAMAAFFLLIALFTRFWFQGRLLVWQWITGALAFIIFWKLKYYYAGVFVAVVATSMIYRKVMVSPVRHGAFIQSVVWIGIFLLPLVMVSFLHPNFNLDRLLGVIVSNNSAYNELSQPGEYVRFFNRTADPISLLLNVPWALFSGLFRPLFWETSSIVQFVQGAENSVLLFLAIAAIFQKRNDSGSSHRLLILTVVAFVVLAAVLITMSAPNFGTLSRYRIGYISVFTFIILCNNPVLLFLQRRFPILPVLSGKS